MDWLLGKREKSVARNAQLAVKSMHMHMDKQGHRIRELEGLVLGESKIDWRHSTSLQSWLIYQVYNIYVLTPWNRSYSD